MASIGEFLAALGHYNFLQSALLASVMVGVMSGIIGSFIILRGMSLMGDAISHSVLPGVAVAYMLGINLMVGAAAFGVIAVSDRDLMSTVAVLVIVVLFVVIFYKELLITSFDETFAKTYGLQTAYLHYGLMLVLTLVTVSALQTVGIILIVAMLITPAATAFLWTNRLQWMLVIAASVGAVASVIGLYLSYTMNWASGPAIVLMAAIMFLVSFVVSPKQGFLTKWGKQSV